MDNIIDSLPTELLPNVFENLSNDDIFNMPPDWISSGFTESQAQALLGTMYVSLEKSSLTRLERIICHPDLARYVHRLTLHDERVKEITAYNYLHSHWSTHYQGWGFYLPKYPSFASYIQMAQEQISGQSSVAAKYGKYRMLLKEQQLVEERQDDIRILSKAFDVLPNLEVVSVDNSRQHRVKKTLGDAWCDDLKEHCIANCGSHLMEVLFRAMSNSVRKVPSFEIMHSYGRRDHRSNITTMNFPGLVAKLPPNTIASAAQGLRSLGLRSIYYGLHEVDYHDAAREMSDGYSWLHTFHKGEAYDSTKGIAEMLSSASMLEDLTLTCLDLCKGRYQKSHLPYLSLNSMRGVNDLQHLQKLSLGHFKTRQDQFVRFLLQVAGALTTIKLNGIVLDHGSWVSTFSELRGKFSRLESIKVGTSRLYDAGLGEDDWDSEELSSSAMTRKVEFCIVPCGDQHLLVWMRDGTGVHPGRHSARR